MGYTVIQCLFLRKNAIPFLKEQKKKKPSLLAAERMQAKSSQWKTTSLYIFFSWNYSCVISFCLVNVAYKNSTWSRGPLLMSVCHNNQLCVYICRHLSVLLTVWFFVLFCLFVCSRFDMFKGSFTSRTKIWFTCCFHLWCTIWSISCIFMHHVPSSNHFC